MKKIIFVIVLGLLMTACSSKLNVVITENIETEYGEELDTAILFDKENSDEKLTVKEVKDFDSKKLGEQEITVVFALEDKTQEEKVKVNVKDTKAPEIKIKKDKMEITEGDKFNPASNIESVKDPIDGDIKKSDDSKITKNGYIITSDVDTKKVKNGYKVKVTAYDANGNKTEKEYTVNVKAKPVEKPQASTSQPANSGGQAASAAPAPSNSQSGGSASGGNASKPQAQPQQCVSNGEFGRVGNSGRVFIGSSTADGKAKAEAWADSVIFDESSPYYMMGYHEWTVYDNCGERNDVWTVEFY